MGLSSLRWYKRGREASASLRLSNAVVEVVQTGSRGERFLEVVKRGLQHRVLGNRGLTCVDLTGPRGQQCELEEGGFAGLQRGNSLGVVGDQVAVRPRRSTRYPRSSMEWKPK
jgi:hypothetical protein